MRHCVFTIMTIEEMFNAEHPWKQYKDWTKHAYTVRRVKYYFDIDGNLINQENDWYQYMSRKSKIILCIVLSVLAIIVMCLPN